MGGALKGWKYVGFISGIVGFIGVALYPVIIYPLQNIEIYSKYSRIHP
jgi:hypothetical protein